MSPLIACLGPEGTFSYWGALRYTELTRKSFSPLCLPDMGGVLNSVESGFVEEAIVPIENLIEGTITQPLDFLVHACSTYVVAEMVMEIRQDLIGWEGTDLAHVTKVISHPQPLAQCMKFIEKNMPGAELEYSPSTVEAIKRVCHHKGRKDLVAIGNSSVNSKYGLITLAQNISDVQNNKTRFLILRHQKEISPDQSSQKITIVFSLPQDQPGGLYKILGLLSHINLTKIESRPSKEVLGEYYFFIDLLADYSQSEIRDTLKKVEAHADTFKILGAYSEVKRC